MAVSMAHSLEAETFTTKHFVEFEIQSLFQDLSAKNTLQGGEL